MEETKVIDFKFSNTEYARILNKIIESLKSDDDKFDNLNKIDLKYYDKKINLDKIINIIEQYRYDEINNEKKIEIYLIKYNGNPYLTVQLCLYAILNKIQISLDFEEYMLGINSGIITIFNSNLEKYGIKNLIKIAKKDSNEFEKFGKIIVIDNLDLYNEIKRENVKFAKFESIDLYCDDDNLVELRDMICKYAEANNIDAEIYDDYDRNKVADTISKYGSGAITVLLSADTELQQEFKERINNRKLYINEQPFKDTRKLQLKI